MATTKTTIDPSAKSVLLDALKQWGLSSLAKDAEDLWKSGLDAAAVTVELQNTDAYKKRFAANETRRKKGLAVLSPAEYLAAESSYQTVLRNYGLPKTFYDSHGDFANFIGNDVSADELNHRAQIAQQIWLSQDTATKNAWKSFYGLSDGAAIASILDPAKATPVIERMANAAKFGGLATANGLEANKGRLEQYSDMGVSADTVASAFGKIAQTKSVDAKIGQRFGKTISQTDQEKAQITNNGVAQKKINDLYASESALFQNRAAAETGALSRTKGGNY